MLREDIVEELKRRGYKVEEYEAVKNGVICEGILFRCENGISPVIYTKELIEKEEQGKNSVEHVTDLIIAIFKAHREPDFDINLLTDREFVLSNIRVGLQKRSRQHLVKKACKLKGIEAYLYCALDSEVNRSAKLTPEFLELVGIEQYDAWEEAYKNTFAETMVLDMDFFTGEFWNMEQNMYVVGNISGKFGASAILDSRSLRELDEKIENETHKFFVLPSSIHEVIVIPYDPECELEDLSEMVRNVNEHCVKPEEQLSDRAYIIEV